MYRYNEVDRRLVKERVGEFRDQVQRRLDGTLAEEDFLPLRLMNGVYHQRHSYMLRVGIPYGLLSSAQMRALGRVADRYDRGFGHFTTRQNIQYNWVKLEEVPDLLDELADVEMHAIQTSGNCIRNITCDPYAGVARDELFDPRPYCEILRQYKEVHPEFMYLPRKFKIAVTGATTDRAATAFHDIGLQGVERDGNIGWRVLVGGGMGRTPRIAEEIRSFLPVEHTLTYIEAILRVYNLHGRRDNKYRARIKILVGDMGADLFGREVEDAWQEMDRPLMDAALLADIQRHFETVTYRPEAADHRDHLARAAGDPAFGRWLRSNTRDHKVDGYHVVTLSLKAPGLPPGDMVTDQFYAVADLMDRVNQGVAVVTYNQNLALQHVEAGELSALYDQLVTLGLATANVDTITDQICCPGLDYCNLASAESIPVAQKLSERFSDEEYIQDVGLLHVNMSGCVNACGHHHTGHIGLLGVEKSGSPHFQVAIGGHAGSDDARPASVAKVLGQAVKPDEAVEVVARLVEIFRERREEGEVFLDTVNRLGIEPFKEALRG